MIDTVGFGHIWINHDILNRDIIEYRDNFLENNREMTFLASIISNWMYAKQLENIQQ